MFFFDDLLLVFLVKELKLFNLAGIYYAIVLIVFFTTSIGLALVVFKMMQKKPQTGKEGLVDQIGVVIYSKQQLLNVAVLGEIWQATCDEKLSVKTKVRIISVDGLVLIVKREN